MEGHNPEEQMKLCQTRMYLPRVALSMQAQHTESSEREKRTNTEVTLAAFKAHRFFLGEANYVQNSREVISPR